MTAGEIKRPRIAKDGSTSIAEKNDARMSSAKEEVFVLLCRDDAESAVFYFGCYSARVLGTLCPAKKLCCVGS